MATERTQMPLFDARKTPLFLTIEHPQQNPPTVEPAACIVLSFFLFSSFSEIPQGNKRRVYSSMISWIRAVPGSERNDNLIRPWKVLIHVFPRVHLTFLFVCLCFHIECFFFMKDCTSLNISFLLQIIVLGFRISYCFFFILSSSFKLSSFISPFNVSIRFCVVFFYSAIYLSSFLSSNFFYFYFSGMKSFIFFFVTIIFSLLIYLPYFLHEYLSFFLSFSICPFQTLFSFLSNFLSSFVSFRFVSFLSFFLYFFLISTAFIFFLLLFPFFLYFPFLTFFFLHLHFPFFLYSFHYFLFPCFVLCSLFFL